MISLLLPLFVLCLATLIATLAEDSLLEPGVVIGGLWCLVIALSLGNLHALPSPVSLWAVVAITVSFMIGSMLVHSLRHGHARLERCDLDLEPARIRRFLRAVIVLTAPGALVATIGIASYGIVAFGLEASPAGLMELGNRYSIARYSGDPGAPIGLRFLQYLQYPAALAGGLLLSYRVGKKELALSLAPLAIAVGGGFVVAARAGLILATVAWLGGAWAGWRAMGAGRGIGSRKDRRPAATAVAMLIFLVGAWIFFAWVRIGAPRLEDTVIITLTEKLYASTLSYVFAFSEWLGNWNGELTHGRYTFAGPADLLGLSRREQGLFSEGVMFGQSSPNIFTAYRGLIQDYSLTGAIALAGLAGMVSKLVYWRARSRRFLPTLALSFSYALILLSPLVSPFAYNTGWFAWPLLVMLWLVHRYVRFDARRKRPH